VAHQNEYDRNHAEQRADRQQEINRFPAVSMDYLIARYSKKTASLFDNFRQAPY